MRRYLLVILGIVMLVLVGCAAGELITRNYYILEYFSHSEKEDLKQAESIAATAFVLDAEIPRSYNRKQLVIRHFGPRITYSDYDLWGFDLSEGIPNLLSERLESYNIFEKTQREYWSAEPEYEIRTLIHNLELNRSASVNQARLNITFILKETGSEIELVKFSSNAERELPDNHIDTFVQSINELILNQADKFAYKILVEFNKRKAISEEKDVNQENLSAAMVEIYEKEETSSSKGLLLLPALSDTDYEPYYTITDKYNYSIDARIGEAVPLMQGVYTISYGSGDDQQRMVKESVEIMPRYKTIIEPDWGSLIIDIIDENRNFAKVRYEIFDLENGESYGSEFPAEKEVGEQEKVWMLKPGLYKITVNNEPFNTYCDFTTVKVDKGELRQLTIVMNTDDDDNPTTMAGAGILDEDNLDVTQELIKYNSAIHGNINLNSDNEEDENKQEYSLTLNGQLENYLLYNTGPIHYKLKHLMELGLSKESETDLHLAIDDFDLKNTGIYYFLENLGFYGRFDLNTHLFTNKYRSQDGFNLTKINADGDTLAASQFVKEFDTRPNFFPLTMKEGLGINYRVLNFAKANLSIRSGLGFRQEYNDDVFNLIDSGSENDVNYRIYQESESISTTGTEFSIEGNFSLPFDLSYSTNADVLIPFDKDEDYTMEWENIFNLKLFKYISLDYKIKLENKQQAADEYYLTKHSLFLRITYFLR